jgi:putative DNA primase/helicase
MKTVRSGSSLFQGAQTTAVTGKIKIQGKQMSEYETGPEDTDAFDDLPAELKPVPTIKVKAVKTSFAQSAAAPDFAEFPAEMKEKPVWCLWKYGYRDGKKTKIPYRNLGQTAASDNPKTWISFGIAVTNLHKFPDKVDGIGCFVHDGYTFFDIDDCRNGVSGELEPWAAEIVSELNTYAELSPSGTGVHVYLRGAVQDASKINGCEIYSKNRFFTVTGERLPGAPPEIKSYSHLADLRERIAGNKLRPYQLQKSNNAHNRTTQSKKSGLIAYAPADLPALLAGDLSRYDNDDSRGDLAACNLLLRRYDGNVEKAEEVFRASALMRDKWDERRGAKTYGEKTMALALKSYEEWKALPPETNTVHQLQTLRVVTAIVRDPSNRNRRPADEEDILPRRVIQYRSQPVKKRQRY